jgi:MFS family permease
VLLVLAGYVPFIAVFPVYVTESVGLGAHVVSIAFVAKTLTVTLAQLVTLRLVRRRRRTDAIIAVCCCWAAASCLVLVFGRSGGAAAIAAYVSAAVLIGVGETMLSPALLPLANDLATERLRGRYNAATSLAFTAGFTAGPALTGLMLERGLGPQLITALIVMCGLAAFLAHRLSLRLPVSANEITQAPRAAPADAVHR